ncbi:hypothetical protein L1987_85091 [Smallanthus sonchifolius]|uniref:Uncharacterized protein n=1 Tax=Smallanthus sonchifolius TaxID=185202 RepID=A0ACB8XWM0_9ASTR|nr:hypothetical protein L1987_85091 [Smallanthus sonchifolius]
MEGVAIFLLMFSSLSFQKIYSAELNTISDTQFLTDGDTLVSPNRNFELGFFKPGSSKNRYLGIWYKKGSVRTVVWVANRENPLVGPASNMLKMTHTGVLTLFNNITHMVWSSNITTSRNTTVKLLDNGNLVVINGNLENVLWQSFDYPTDTLIPGMRFGRDYLTGKEWYLTSWTRIANPARGEFSWRVDSRSYPQNVLQQGGLIKYRAPWISILFDRDSALSLNLSFIYNNEAAVMFTSNPENIWRLTLTSSGAVKVYFWSENGKKWQDILALPEDICDTYNICSAYASCRIKASQTCSCLDETRFVPRNKKDWEMADWSSGCVRRTPLDCRSDGFIKYSDVKLPDTQTSWYNRSMAADECEAKCLQNCSCVAYANTDIISKGRGCLLWFSDLKDIRDVSNSYGGQDIFVRMAYSELGNDIQKKIWERQEEDIQLSLFSFNKIANATRNFSPDKKIGEGGFGVVYKVLLFTRV